MKKHSRFTLVQTLSCVFVAGLAVLSFTHLTQPGSTPAPSNSHSGLRQKPLQKSTQTSQHPSLANFSKTENKAEASAPALALAKAEEDVVIPQIPKSPSIHLLRAYIDDLEQILERRNAIERLNANQVSSQERQETGKILITLAKAREQLIRLRLAETSRKLDRYQRTFTKGS